MAENFYTILTATGKAKLANSAVLGSKVNFKTLKVGDGKGSYYQPTENQISLVNQVWSGNISSISVDENNPNWIVIETLIPATIGGFFIREAGIFDEDDDLIAISKLSETYKPVVSEGSIKDLCIKIILEVSNVENVTLKIDPTVIVATKKDIDILEAKIKETNANVSKLFQQSKTYAELAALVANKKLVPGTQYVLNDYRTKYQQPDTLAMKEMAVERLVLTAIDVDKFSPTCSSLDYPQDIITYKFDNNICEDTTTPRNGFIMWRRSTIKSENISAPLDWRTMLWARYTPDQNNYLIGATSTPYSVWTSGAPSLDVIYKVGNALYVAINTNVPASNIDSNVFVKILEDVNIGIMTGIIGDLSIGATASKQVIKLKKSATVKEYLTFGTLNQSISFDETWLHNNVLHNNVFLDNCNNISVGTCFLTNTLLGGCCAITFASDAKENIIFKGCSNFNTGTNFIRNVLGAYSGADTFSANSFNNVFGYSFAYNNCGADFHDNIFGTYAWSNNFGPSCYSNIAKNRFQNNSLGSKCYLNLFGSDCYANSFESNCCGNTFGNNCSYNQFGANCNSNTLGNLCGSNTFGATCYSNVFGDYCSNNSFTGACHNNTLANACTDNLLGSDCFLNTLGAYSVNNVFSASCNENTFGNNCQANLVGTTNNGNTFGNQFCNLNIKYLRGKNISGVSTLVNRDYTTTIEKRSDGVVVFWTLNSSNIPVYTTIA